jgi:diguanylate cyclase (GGDEF)-like protein
MIFNIYILIDLNNISKTLKDMEKEKVSLYVKNNIPTFATLLMFNFDDDLKAEMKKTVDASDDIVGLEIKSNDNKKTYRYIKKFSNCTVSFPLKFKNDNIGKITAYYDNKTILNMFFERYLIRFAIYVIIFLPLILFMFVFLRKKIAKLNQLAKNVENINFRKTSKINKIDSYYEIVNITTAINKLLNQINLFYTAQKNMLRKMVKLKKHLESAQKIADIYSWEYDCKNKKIELTPQFKRFLGIKENIVEVEFFAQFVNIEAKSIFEHLDENCKKCDEFEIVHKVITKNNKEYYFKTIGKCVKSKQRHNVICVSMNITEDIKKQKEIEFLAYHDPLTSLPNRTYLKEQFKLIENIARRENKKFAVLYLDMDNFKMINDTLGHENGDRLLIQVSQRIKNILRQSDIIARIGGDEFVIILNGINNKNDVVNVVNKLIDSLKQSIKIKQTNVFPTFSIGCAIFPDDSDNSEELLRYADIAMYEAKSKGKNNCAFIDENLKEKTNEFYVITNELKNALKNNELVLYFQPKINIREKKVYGVEGLIRWKHPTKGILTPYKFIPYAEKSNLITEIDRYVLKTAFETLLKWSKESYLSDLSLAINISANEFRHKDFILNLKRLLSEYNIDPSKLEIEITETLSMQDIGYTVTVLEEIKSLGFKIALDDFGTGYSSLNYLKKLPFDTLKIDQSFIKDLLDDYDDLVITKMIVQIAEVLKKSTVAEGVENEKLLKIVSDLGCELVQGYYFAKPLEEEKLKEFVKKFGY